MVLFYLKVIFQCISNMLHKHLSINKTVHPQKAPHEEVTGAAKASRVTTLCVKFDCKKGPGHLLPIFGEEKLGKNFVSAKFWRWSHWTTMF